MKKLCNTGSLEKDEYEKYQRFYEDYFKNNTVYIFDSNISIGEVKYGGRTDYGKEVFNITYNNTLNIVKNNLPKYCIFMEKNSNLFSFHVIFEINGVDYDIHTHPTNDRY